MACVSNQPLNKAPNWLHSKNAAFSLSGLKARLLYPTFHLGTVGWLIAAVLTLAAGLLRFWNLAHPHELIFDETYYVKDAYSLWHFGYERSWGDDVDDAFVWSGCLLCGAPTGWQMAHRRGHGTIWLR